MKQFDKEKKAIEVLNNVIKKVAVVVYGAFIYHVKERIIYVYVLKM